MRMAALVLAACLAGGAAQAQAAPYVADYTAKLPGDGGWDYVTFDAARNLVFVGRPGGVLAVNAAGGALAGRIGSERGNHGAEPADNIDRVFTSESDASGIGVYALSTLARLDTIRLAHEPDALLYDAPRKLLVVMSRRGHSLIVIDAAQSHVRHTIDMGSAVEAAAIDDQGTLFVDLPERGEVARVDLSGTVTARWPVVPCEQPSSLALDHATHRLFVGCRNKLMALVDAGSGRVLDTAPIGGGTDSMAFDATRRVALSANGEGYVSVVPELGDRLGPPRTLPTARTARTLALDPVTGRLFLVAADVASIDPLLPGQERPVVHYVPGSFRMLAFRPAG